MTSRPDRDARLTFGLLYLAWCVCYLDRAAVPFAAPAMIRDIHMSPVQQGFALGCFYLSYAFMQAPGGWLADRFGAKRVVIAGLVGWSAFTLGTGLVQSAAALLCMRLLFGIGEGIFPAASLRALYDTVPASARDKAPSALMSSNYFGYLIAPTVLLPLLAWFGWRSTFYVMSAIGVLSALLFLALAPGRPAAPSPALIGGNAMLRVLRLPGIDRLMATWFFVSFINKALESWMPTYLLHARGVSLKAAGILLTIPYLAATVAALIGGWVMTRWFAGREDHFISISMVISCVALVAMAWCNAVIAIIGAETVLYFFKTLVFAAVLCLPGRILPQDIAGTGYGLINFGGQIAGFVAPPVIGAVLSASGSYPTAFLSLLVAGMLALVLNITLGRFGQTQESSTPTVGADNHGIV
ncbi:MFS transporter [Gluconacetobacter tumulicola]|uniref:MFS transporter n=1 Tax=Gluconacetobacter tumulicola TaxID=1017177 RepID=A0A7W4JCJ3_9PROT|nr:MFS transporter [Gluconacetobacter tumulicola]MBB2178748.1 MFS transporter [Gluconacetobacter tumulicola]